MADEKTGDLLGIAPYGEAVKVVAQGVVDGAGAFLGRICLPAAEEFGLLMRDRVAEWRRKNAVTVAQAAERMLEGGGNGLHAHPRLVIRIIEDGSWSDDNIVQKMWAGLLASSCCSDGRDESNLPFVNLLAQLTLSEVRIIRFACESCEKCLTPAGWIGARQHMPASASQLQDATGLADLHRIDRELDHLRCLGLLDALAGFNGDVAHKVACMTPSPLALQMYARAQGYNGPPEKFYGLEPASPQTTPVSNTNI